MEITRRAFLKATGTAAVASVLMSRLGFDLSHAEAYARELRIKGAKETTTICCYCSVGCGILVHSKEGKVINTEGDPDHPINEGSLCSKGSSRYQVVNNENRLRKPRYRAPGSVVWKDVEWDWALDQIARRIKDTRDRTFKATTRTKIREKKVADTPDESGLFPEIVTDVEKECIVNRTDGIAHVGSAALDNEECYLIQKLVRSWGVVHVAEAEIPAPAEKVYRAAVSMAEARAPVVKILKKDDEKLLLAVTDDIQKASFKAESISQEKTAVIVKADVPKVEGKEKEYEKEREKDLALRIIDNLCTKLNVQCSVINK